MSSLHHRVSWSNVHLDSRFGTTLLAFVAATVCYLSTRLAGALVIHVPQMIWPLWPGCALLVAILLLVPRKIWPALLPAGLVGFVLYDLQVGMSFKSIAWFILADTLEILVAAWGTSYFFAGRPRLNSFSALVKYSFPTVFLASLVVFIGVQGSGGDVWLLSRLSFLSEALAFLTVTPAIIGLFDQGWPPLRSAQAYYLEAVALILALSSLSYFIFVAPGRIVPPALLYSLVPFLIWSALRFGSAGVGTLATIVALMSIWGAVHGRGPFGEADPINRVLYLQLFLFFTSLPFMVLAVLVEERKLTQSELHKSEERLRSAMKSGKAIGWEWDVENKRNFWFGDLKTMFGIPSDTYVGGPEDFHRFVHPDDWQQISAAIDDARNNRQSYAEEFRVAWPDGTVRWLAASGKFYYSPHGEPGRMRGIAVDITDRKQVEQALRESEADLMEAQRLANMGSWQWDIQTDTVTWSEQLYRIAGRDPALPAVTYQDHATLYTHESWLRLRSAVEEALRSGASYELDLEMNHTDGTRRWIIAKGEVRRDGAGHVVKLRGTVDDITERRRVQEDLRKSEQRLRLAIQAGKMFACDWDPATDVFAQSPESAKILGIDYDTPLTRLRMIDLVHPEDRERFVAAVANLSPERPDIGIIHRMVRPDGSIIWVERNSRAQFDEHGKLLRIIGIVADITERKRAEQALRESEERLRLAVQAGKMFAYEWDAATDSVVRSSESAEILGIAETTPLTGQQILTKVHPDDREKLLAAMAQLSDAKPSLAVTYRVFRPDGSLLWVERNSRAHFDEHGKLLRIIGIVADVTERKRAEEAVRESEERFRLMTNNAPMLIWMSDIDKLCTYFNRSWLAFTGRSMDQELGNGWAESVHPDDLRGCIDSYVRAFDAREKFTIEYRLRRFDGEFRWILDIGVPRFNQDGSFAGYIGSCVDVTDRKLAEQTLSGVNRSLIDAQERERARIARELHDDVGQRLALLTVELERLRQNVPALPVELHSRIGELQKHSAEIATDVQAMSHKLHSSKLQFLGITLAMKGFCKEFSKQQNVEVIFVHDDIPGAVPQEVSLCLFRVLQEALQNALKHSGVRRFDVQLCYASDAIVLTVRDSGCGFDVAAPMYSQGLGLISMAERMKLVDGHLAIDSQPQSGTTVSATVPLSKAARASA
jgi:PAS domain S-box-containing protein